MKRLLLLFLLSPIILFGQARRKAIVDSFKAAGNLQNVSAVINNYPDTKVERIHASDSGEYVTIVMRVRIADNTITSLPSLPAVKIKTGAIVIPGRSTVTVPSLPDPVAEPVALIAVTELRIINPLAGNMDIVIVPPLPEVELETTGPLPTLAVVVFPITSLLPKKTDTVEALSLEEKKMELADMHLSDKGYSLLEKMEGFSPEPYALGDGGMTIGFGFFIPDGERRRWDKGITWEAAEIMIRQKMQVYEDQVKQYINVQLTQEEFDALTMMAYNLGGFSKATSIVNDINTNADFDKLQKDWMRFVHSKAPGVMKGLVNRRKDELQVRAESEYQAERKIQIFKNRK